MSDKKFDPRQIHKLNNPERLKTQNPDLIWQTLGLKQARRLVDIGAGTGFFAVPFCDKMEDGIVYACDTSDTMLQWMKENLADTYTNRVIPLKSSESQIPLEGGLADLVYMINLHHELEDPCAMLEESARLLKPGGKLMIIDWKVAETPGGPPQSIRIPESTIAAQLQNAGFTAIQHHDTLPYHCFLVATKA